MNISLASLPSRATPCNDARGASIENLLPLARTRTAPPLTSELSSEKQARGHTKCHLQALRVAEKLGARQNLTASSSWDASNGMQHSAAASTNTRGRSYRRHPSLQHRWGVLSSPPTSFQRGRLGTRVCGVSPRQPFASYLCMPTECVPSGSLCQASKRLTGLSHEPRGSRTDRLAQPPAMDDRLPLLAAFERYVCMGPSSGSIACMLEPNRAWFGWTQARTLLVTTRAPDAGPPRAGPV